MAGRATWTDRVLVALAVPQTSAQDVTEAVALRFADRFDAEDRQFTTECPRWHGEVRAALDTLRADGAVRYRETPAPEFFLTVAGRARLDRAAVATTHRTGRTPAAAGDASAALVVSGVVAAPLRSGETRERIGLAGADDEPVPVIAEVNRGHRAGTGAAFARLERLWTSATGGRTPGPSRISDEYLAGELSMHEMARLVAADAVPVRWPDRALHRIWPDFAVQLQVDASSATIKADAARRTFDADGAGIVWAVIDSGIAADHPHFAAHHTLDHESVRELHRAFPGNGEETTEGALLDEHGHGTHVAGIIAGAIEPWLAEQPNRQVRATQQRFNIEDRRTPLRVPRADVATARLAGIAPRARLVSLKVLQPGGSAESRVQRVIQALAYVRTVNGATLDRLRIHGVNLSLGYEFDPEWFACGSSPLCREVDKLVRSGVVVVVAAGNSGFGTLSVQASAPTRFGLPMTINDPGNARLAITVGSTHRSAPHTYGISYFSSKGPTGDGRMKPDLVAPGERITSCAAGGYLVRDVAGGQPDTAYYTEESGTSMAAPHVSGAIAALLSARREFAGDPEKLKKIFVESATSLGRGPEFQGAGLLDLLRALQSV